MSEELNVLKEVTKCLEEAHVPYMITGSTAANFYALPRMTRDIDIVIQVAPLDADKLLKIFSTNFYIDEEAVTEALRSRGMFNIIHNQSVIKVDFIVQKDSSYRKCEFDRRRSVTVGDTSLWLVSPEDLVLSKLLWAKDNFSEIQLKDVKNILSTVTDLDNAYLERWIDALGLEKIYEQVHQ